MHDGVFVHVHQVESLAAVARPGAAHGDVQVLGVTGGGGHRYRNTGEGGSGGVMQVPGQDGADIRVAEHCSEGRLAPEFDEDGKVQH